MTETTKAPTPRRLAILAIYGGWWGLLAYLLFWAFPQGEAMPERALSLLAIVYLAAWGPFFIVSRWSPAGRFIRFAACSASIAAALALVELPAALNLIDYRGVFHTPTAPWLRPGNAADDDLLFVREPNQRLRLAFRGADLDGLTGAGPSRVYQCETTLDGDGFRNPPGLAKARAVLVGDSFIEGLQVTDRELVSSRLAELLGAPVANLGRTGYGPQQELEVVRRFALKYKPQTLVWAFYEGNDLQDVQTYEDQRQRVLKSRSDSAYRRRSARSFARNAALWLLRTWNAEPMIPARSRAGTFHDSKGAEVDVYFSCGVHEGDDDEAFGRLESDELMRFQEILSQAHEICRRREIDLIVAFVPSKFRVLRDFCRFEADSPCPDWPVDELPEAVERLARDVSPEIGFLDLTPAMRTRAEAGALPYLIDDTHWSPEGHQTAAAALTEFIGGRGTSANGSRDPIRAKLGGASGSGGRLPAPSGDQTGAADAQAEQGERRRFGNRGGRLVADHEVEDGGGLHQASADQGSDGREREVVNPGLGEAEIVVVVAAREDADGAEGRRADGRVHGGSRPVSIRVQHEVAPRGAREPRQGVAESVVREDPARDLLGPKAEERPRCGTRAGPEEQVERLVRERRRQPGVAGHQNTLGDDDRDRRGIELRAGTADLRAVDHRGARDLVEEA